MIRPSRRDFLKILLATPLATTYDYEQLLWVPRPQIIVPAINVSEIIEAEMNRIRPYLATLFDRDDLFYKIMLREKIGVPDEST